MRNRKTSLFSSNYRNTSGSLEERKRQLKSAVSCYLLSVKCCLLLEYLTNITEIETEGVQDGTTNLWVESYYVSTSNGTDETSFVEYTEEGKTKMVSTGLMLIGLTKRFNFAIVLFKMLG